VHQEIPTSLKGELVDDRGVAYREFRKQLRPRYGRAWLDIGAGYAGVVAVLVALAAWDARLPLAAAGVATGGLAIGYLLAFLNNFFHEAAHHNLHPDRRRNDLLANLLMGWLYGSSIQQYRRSAQATTVSTLGSTP